LWLDGAGYRPPHAGRSLRLSLDLVIQSIAEEELEERCLAYDAPQGQLIVMQPHTGEILAMANYPRFDPRDLSKASPEDWRNRCVTDAFEPGSTFKPFVWSLATEGGLAEPAEIIDCTSGGVYYSDEGRRLRDSKAMGRITWEEVLSHSSNIGMAKVAQRTDADRLHAMVSAFGFGRPTGSGLPGEIGGLLRPAEQWTHYSMTSIPMGQEIAVTALQMVRGYATLVNGGRLVRPSILAVDEPMLEELTPPRSAGGWSIIQRVISGETSALVCRAMRRSVLAGTGRRARSRLYPLFGKTGTSQIPDLVRGGYRDRAYVASFIAGAPYHAPELVVGCFIHEPNPKKGYYGGLVSGPVVKNVIERSLSYLGVPPMSPEQAEAEMSVPRKRFDP
jgi:cell division protein FtsI (penicillin-binding protein 3)